MRKVKQWFSAWKLRAEAEDRDVPVSHKQFEGYRKWGLIPDPEDGGWLPATVDRLIRIRKLKDQTRPLWRRAILLHAQYYPVAPRALREAMLRTLPTIKAPKRKMRRIDAVIRWEAKKLEDPAYAGMMWSKPARRTDDFMEPNKWKTILGRRDFDDKLFAAHSSTMCYFAIGLKHGAQGTGLDISSIPDEEVIILLTVRQLTGLAIRVEAS